MEAVIPELIEIGVDILNPVQPECLDPMELKRRYGEHVLGAQIGIQHTLPSELLRKCAKRSEPGSKQSDRVEVC